MRQTKDTAEKRKIVLTGGHAATTAISVVEQLLRKRGNFEWDIHWIGATKAIEGKSVPTLEYQIFPKLNVKFHPIIAGRIQKRFGIWTVPSLIKIPIGFIHALLILLEIRPKLIVSFGGFASFPVVTVGWILRIPIIIHEQTSTAGRANRYSSFFASKIALAREKSLRYFPKGKSKVIGNPLLSNIREILPKEKIGDPATILVTAGSRGSQRINSLIEPILEKLLRSYCVIHITGQLDFNKFSGKKVFLDKTLSKNYEIYSTVDPMQIGGLYKRSDIVIGRAGANTVSEIIATKRPSILIPIPWSYLDEQNKNAKYAEKMGIATIINQEEATPEALLIEVSTIKNKWNDMVRKVTKDNPDIYASGKFVGLIEEYFEK